MSQVMMSCLTVMHDCFKSTILSSLCAFVLLALSEEAKTDLHFFHSVFNKTIILFFFCDIQNNQGFGNC